MNLQENIKRIKELMSINEEYIDNDGNLKDLTQSDINEILKGYIDCALWTEQERRCHNGYR